MKTSVKYFVVTFLALSFLVSCGPSSEKRKSDPQNSLLTKLETVSMGIEGMTCAIGCAKTIEAKISKLEGVTKSKVDFDSKKGTFTYNPNKTSEASIITTINGLLDGKTYKAVKEIQSKETLVCSAACSKKGEHKTGACCSKAGGHECAMSCSEKCEIKKEACCVKANKDADRNISCKPGCEKPCCSMQKDNS